MSAISAIDIALWDIKGKALGVPVYELLGGLTRDKVRVYASPMVRDKDPEQLAKRYIDLKKQGFTAAKIFVNGNDKSLKKAMTNISPVVSRWNLKSEDLQRSRGI